MKYTAEVTVRYAETDRMGIGHHSNYAIWFEVARTEFIKNLGVSYSECEKQGVMLPLFSLEVEFLKPAYYEDVLLVETYIKKMSPVRLVMVYQVYCQKSHVLVAKGETSHAWTDIGLHPINLKKHNQKIYDLLMSAREESL